MIAKNQFVGAATTRVDGRQKVTGTAKYSAEFNPADLVHGYIVNSTIATGTIGKIDSDSAKQVPGVRAVFTHENVPASLTIDGDYSDPLAPPGNPFRPLYNDKILYNGQPIAMVVADTFEVARYAAGLIKVTYSEKKGGAIALRENLDTAFADKDVPEPAEARGDAKTAFEKADIKVEASYYQAREYHNPMESFATVAIWDDQQERFLIYDKIQGVGSSQKYISGIFNLDKDKVRVMSEFVGGGFGSGLRPQYQLFFAAMASKELNLPVKVVMTRQQMFSFGHRSACFQEFKLGADATGKLSSIQHKAYGETSRFEKYNETIVDWSGLMYACDNVALDYKLVPLDVYTPNDMRAPGGATGMYGLECAIDELAVAVGIDPLKIRLINYAEKDQNEDKPFSSKELKACYSRAAKEFGWESRKAEPRSNTKGNLLIGHGLATGVWEAMQQKASAEAIFTNNGRLIIRSGTADIGTGTYTVMTQIAADALGLSLEYVDFRLGDTTLPKAPIEGGSWTVSSVGSAVKMVCVALREKIFKLAKKTHSDLFKDQRIEEVTFANGEITAQSGRAVAYVDILAASEKESLNVTVNAEPDEDRDDYSCYTHSCVMVEVEVDEDLGMIKVQRVVSAIAGGKIMNPKTAKSQIIGGITWGIGMALEEEGMMDPRDGRIMNANLAEYHMPIHADIQEIDVIFVEEHDEIVNPLGAKGLGEIGLVGVAAAIANAIYNATGKRVRELPIKLDTLL